MRIVDRIRKWIDQDAEDPLGEIAKSAKQRRDAEDLIVHVSKEIDAKMQEQMITLPSGVVNIPPKFLVFLSARLDKEWAPAAKRQILSQALNEITCGRARDLKSNSQSTNDPKVEIRVDGTLASNSFRVQAMWDDDEEPTTFVPEEMEETVLDPSLGAELYSISIYKDGVKQENHSVKKSEITIGRGSRERTVDLAIKGDPNVSRIHAILTLNDSGKFFLEAKGLNPTFVDGRDIRNVQKPHRLLPGQKIRIGTYTLTVQPPKSSESHKRSKKKLKTSRKTTKKGRKRRS